MSNRDKAAELFNWETFNEPLSRKLSDSLKASVWDLERGINKTLGEYFYLPENPSKRSHIWFKQKNGKVYSAELTYSYASIPLSRYPVKQYRITTGSKILRVSRGGKTPGPGFKKQIVPRANIATYVQIRRAGGLKLVEGTLGFKGWLHTGRRHKETGFNGQTNTFSSNIFERNQQETWSGGVRQPIHSLYGPSITQLLQTKEMQSALETLFTKLGRNF